MADEKRLVWIGEVETELRAYADRKHAFGQAELANGILKAVNHLQTISTAKNAVEVVHGRWERSGGDLHSSGYAVYCSVCHKNHFVHYKHSLGGLFGCKELFEKPKYCPSCGAVMEVEE